MVVSIPPRMGRVGVDLVPERVAEVAVIEGLVAVALANAGVDDAGSFMDLEIPHQRLERVLPCDFTGVGVRLDVSAGLPCRPRFAGRVHERPRRDDVWDLASLERPANRAEGVSRATSLQ